MEKIGSFRGWAIHTLCVCVLEQFLIALEIANAFEDMQNAD